MWAGGLEGVMPHERSRKSLAYSRESKKGNRGNKKKKSQLTSTSETDHATQSRRDASINSATSHKRLKDFTPRKKGGMLSPEKRNPRHRIKGEKTGSRSAGGRREETHATEKGVSLLSYPRAAEGTVIRDKRQDGTVPAWKKEWETG